jgi:hypothetical protein
MKGSLGKDGLVVKQWEVGEDICHLSLDICHWNPTLSGEKSVHASCIR